MYPKFTNSEIKSVVNILKSGKINYWSGNISKKFEKEFGKYHNMKHCLLVSNGSVALEIALKSLNLPKDSEVIVTPRSFIISASCVLNLGLKPVFADVDINGNIAPQSIKSIINKKTKAIIVVHLGGTPCELNEIKTIIKGKKIKLIEDCSQAHGAYYKGRIVGSFGDISTWSFCNDKLISSGEGGAICTNNFSLYKKMWSVRDHGKDYDKVNNRSYLSYQHNFKWLHSYVGSNYRLTEIQSVLAHHQLKNLKKQINKRNKIVNYIINKLEIYKKKGIISNFNDKCSSCISKNNKTCKGCKFSFYRLDIFLDKKFLRYRNKILNKLNIKQLNIGVGSCPFIYKEMVFKKSLDVKKFNLSQADILSKSVISLKINPNLNHFYYKKFTNKLIDQMSIIFNE